MKIKPRALRRRPPTCAELRIEKVEKMVANHDNHRKFDPTNIRWRVVSLPRVKFLERPTS